ncbi:hypothetical protein [Actinomadura sp. HBU206391]|uniref:hypothetical protein n=1 Tax=Actinomadura sp. HBU206391 TaxID=2731692 RepID=UPI00164F07C0|nr:hypothetical protein [Actinomadura sp. HBU206391]MBC6462840.1 hypothetical protein [Actinomadura sp. HBU206391]
MIMRVVVVDLHGTELETIWGPPRVLDAQMDAESVPGIDDGLGVRMQIALCRRQRPVSGDLPDDVDDAEHSWDGYCAVA